MKPDGAEPLPPGTGTAGPAQQGRPLILVVDDTVELGTFVQLLGKRAGQEVVVCHDALAGWNFLQQRMPDLLLLDYNLPGVSGLELCRAIRATPALAPLPIALLGHWHLPQEILAGLQDGIDFVVSKDLLADPQVWQTRIGEILGWISGRRWERLVSWLEEATLPELPEGWAASLNQALRHASLKRLRPQILRFLLLRALRQVVSFRIADAELDHWLAPDEPMLMMDHLPPSLSCTEVRGTVESVIVLVVSLAEQTWCLLGTQATAGFRTALAVVVPGLEEFLAF
jgi:CheY-like chemotaxis protein